ncbi:MAG: DUF1854 domain-containing protein [Clostridia bacterium]|nr:DUF1854 domain-containing protein [Clostridia bacterium]
MAISFLDKSAKIELTDVFYVRLSLKDGTVYENVEVRRLFPISDRENYISLIDSNEHEIAMIRSFDDISEESASAVKACFNDYYLIPKISKVLECNDKKGMLQMTVVTDHGNKSFRIRNRHSDMKIYPEDRVIIRDVDDNRYEIESLAALDRKSWILVASFL